MFSPGPAAVALYSSVALYSGCLRCCLPILPEGHAAAAPGEHANRGRHARAARHLPNPAAAARRQPPPQRPVPSAAERLSLLAACFLRLPRFVSSFGAARAGPSGRARLRLCHPQSPSSFLAHILMGFTHLFSFQLQYLSCQRSILTLPAPRTMGAFGGSNVIPTSSQQHHHVRCLDQQSSTLLSLIHISQGIVR